MDHPWMTSVDWEGLRQGTVPAPVTFGAVPPSNVTATSTFPTAFGHDTFTLDSKGTPRVTLRGKGGGLDDDDNDDDGPLQGIEEHFRGLTGGAASDQPQLQARIFEEFAPPPPGLASMQAQTKR